ncbi:MAG: hypothetical protein LBR29_05125, partial [Methylobacteriaceae bacterium]|nr:hypothetical protein [Methylobacteriaceae bacterium]
MARKTTVQILIAVAAVLVPAAGQAQMGSIDALVQSLEALPPFKPGASPILATIYDLNAAQQAGIMRGYDIEPLLSRWVNPNYPVLSAFAHAGDGDGWYVATGTKLRDIRGFVFYPGKKGNAVAAWRLAGSNAAENMYMGLMSRGFHRVAGDGILSNEKPAAEPGGFSTGAPGRTPPPRPERPLSNPGDAIGLRSGSVDGSGEGAPGNSGGVSGSPQYDPFHDAGGQPYFVRFTAGGALLQSMAVEDLRFETGRFGSRNFLSANQSIGRLMKSVQLGLKNLAPRSWVLQSVLFDGRFGQEGRLSSAAVVGEGISDPSRSLPRFVV